MTRSDTTQLQGFKKFVVYTVSVEEPELQNILDSNDSIFGDITNLPPCGIHTGKFEF